MTEIPRQSDFDDPNIDDDLDRILQHITQDQMERDQVDSPKDDSGTSATGAFGSITPNAHGGGGSGGGGGGQAPLSNSTNSSDQVNSKVGQSEGRHRQYVTNFQLPQDDNYAHEANQRHILLYGVGRAREESKHAVKKVSRELNKLFSKKFCHDVNDGSRVKKHSKNEVNLEGLTGKYCALPYYDQHAVTCSFGGTVVEMFTTFVSGELDKEVIFVFINTNYVWLNLSRSEQLSPDCGTHRLLGRLDGTWTELYRPVGNVRWDFARAGGR